ncbi:hypothetical protein OQA88_5427 [Cercophora sp. LCS_1]
MEASYLRGVIETTRSQTQAGALSETCLKQFYGDSHRSGLTVMLVEYFVEVEQKLQPEASFVPSHFGGRVQEFELPWRTVTWPLKREKAQRLLKDVQSVGHKMTLLLQQGMKFESTESLPTSTTRNTSSPISRKLGPSSNDEWRRWMCPLAVPYWAVHENAEAKMWPGTGEWLRETPQYKAWVSDVGEDTLSLCLSGPSGSGKTTLTAGLITELRKSKEMAGDCILYYFFDIQDAARNTVSSLYSVLTSQLLDRLGEVGMGRVRELAENVVRLQACQPTTDQRVEVLVDHLHQAAKSSNVYVVVGACDECSDFSKNRNVRFLNTILHQDDKRFRLFLTMREERFVPAITVSEATSISLLRNKDVVLEIAKYVRANVLRMGDKAIGAMKRAGEEQEVNMLEEVIQSIC